jgi:hypothetical protein
VTRTPAALLAIAAFASILAMGCGDGGKEINGQIVEAGCGMCQLHMDGRSDCYWAARIDGEMVMVRGDALPSDAEHDSHAPGGMCTTIREARVSGTLYETYFLATEFELLPLAADAVPAPHEHVH